MSIFQKILCIFLLSLVCPLIILTLIHNADSKSEYLESTRMTADASVLYLKASLGIALENRPFEQVAWEYSDASADFLTKSPHERFSEIGFLGLDRKIYSSSNPMNINQKISFEQMEVFKYITRTQLIEEPEFHTVVVPIIYKEAIRGFIYIRSPKHIIDNQLLENWIYNGLITLAILLFASLFHAWATRFFITRHITAFAEAIEKIRQSGDYSLRIGLQQKDELGELAQAFDRMMDWVENARRLLLQTAETHTEKIKDLDTHLAALMAQAKTIAEQLIPETEGTAPSPPVNEALMETPTHGLSGLFLTTLNTVHQKIQTLTWALSRVETDLPNLTRKLAHLELMETEGRAFFPAKFSHFKRETNIKQIIRPPLHFPKNQTIRYLVFDDYPNTTIPYHLARVLHPAQRQYRLEKHIDTVSHCVDDCLTHQPQLIFVDLENRKDDTPAQVEHGLEAIYQMSQAYPQTVIIALSDTRTPDMLWDAIVYGARGVIAISDLFAEDQGNSITLLIEHTMSGGLVFSESVTPHLLLWLCLVTSLPLEQARVMSLLVKGKSIEEIAKFKGTSDRNIKNLMSEINKRFHIDKHHDLAFYPYYRALFG